MESRKKSLLISFVIGDGYLKVDKRYPNGNPSLKLCHSIHQREYLEYKVSLIHSLLGGRYPTVNEYDCTSTNGLVYRQVRAEKSHRYFRVLRRWMYPNKYSPNILKYLTEEALAIWYMDDGSIIPNNRREDGSVSSARTNIHTCCTLEIALDICEYFSNRWGIKFTTFKENGGTYSVRCFHKEGAKFHTLVHPYIIPSMQYKQRFYYDKSA